MTDILLAVDADEKRAIAQAEKLASLDWNRDTTEVTVLHVFTDNVEGASINQLGSARRARKVLEDEGFEVTLSETSGDPGEQVVTVAKESAADLICVGGRKRSPTGKALFGSVSQEVMLSSDCPVLFSTAGKSE